MHGFQVRKINDGVTIGVATTHIDCPHLDTAKINSRLIGENQSRRCILIAPDHIVPGILVNEDFCDVDVPYIAARVVAMVMRVEYKLEFAVFTAELGERHADLVGQRRELVVEDQDSVGPGRDANTAAAAPAPPASRT